MRTQWAGGYCAAHWTRLYTTGDLGPAEVREPKVRGVCQHPDGCERLAHSSGWCHMHAERVKSHGNPGPVGPLVTRRRKQPPTCWVRLNAGGICGKPAHGKGLCNTHHRRWLRRGVVEPYRKHPNT